MFFLLFDFFYYFVVTHIVISVDENGYCPRTMKYMYGLLTGKWIVNFECKVLVAIRLDILVVGCSCLFTCLFTQG